MKKIAVKKKLFGAVGVMAATTMLFSNLANANAESYDYYANLNDNNVTYRVTALKTDRQWLDELLLKVIKERFYNDNLPLLESIKANEQQYKTYPDGGIFWVNMQYLGERNNIASFRLIKTMTLLGKNEIGETDTVYLNIDTKLQKVIGFNDLFFVDDFRSLVLQKYIQQGLKGEIDFDNFYIDYIKNEIGFLIKKTNDVVVLTENDFGAHTIKYLIFPE